MPEDLNGPTLDPPEHAHHEPTMTAVALQSERDQIALLILGDFALDDGSDWVARRHQQNPYVLIGETTTRPNLQVAESSTWI